MVTMLRDLGINSGVRVLEDDILHCSVELFLGPWVSDCNLLHRTTRPYNLEKPTASG